MSNILFKNFKYQNNFTIKKYYRYNLLNYT